MTAAALCTHCHLPVRQDGQQREVNGEQFAFCCYGCCIAFQVGHGQGEESVAAWLLIRLGIGVFFAMFIMLFSLLLYTGTFGPEAGELVQILNGVLWALATPVLIILGGPFFSGAWQAARKGRATADTLVSLGALSAYGYSALQTMTGGSGIYFDTATMVLVLFSVGRYLEAVSRARTARTLAPMLAAERATAMVVANNAEDRELSVGAIQLDMIVRVLPGERVPVDGIVSEGCSQCDEAILTGQHEPQTKSSGDQVYAGSLNGTGQLLVRTTGTGAGTRWGQIGLFVREALQHKSIAGELVDKVAAVFVPAVIALASITLIYWNQRESFDFALQAALAVLVVACPCALGLAAPLAAALGLGQAAQSGVLVRGGGVLERLAAIKAIAFDKTGTLTHGDLRLAGCCVEAADEHTVLAHAAGLAQGSEHPIAKGIAVAACSRQIEPVVFRNIQTRPGHGVAGQAEDGVSAMGSASMMQAYGWRISARLMAQSDSHAFNNTRVYVGWHGQVRGLLGLTDTVLDQARPVVAALTDYGLSTCLLSGDSAAAVARIAAAVGIDNWQAGLSPEAKVTALREWSDRQGSIAMVGDGLNDGPVLAQSSVGIAVGGATDLARETADVTLPEGALERLPWLILLARRVRRTIYTNIAWALGYNMLTLTLAASGQLVPIAAAALMAGSSLVVAINALRVNRDTALVPRVAEPAAPEAAHPSQALGH